MVLTRRHFLCGASALGLSMPLFMHALEAQAAATNAVLVVIEFDGGNDAFNTILDLRQYGPYAGLRPNIAIAQNDIATAGTAFDANVATPSNAATQFAMHPSMTALRGLYAQGRVALLAGIGLPGDAENRFSHEEAKFAWRVGQINKFGIVNTGWVGEAFDQFVAARGTSAPSVPAMISLDGDLPLILRGKKSDPLVLNRDIRYFNPPTGSGGSDAVARIAGLDRNDAYALASVPGEFARATGAETERYVRAIAGFVAAKPLDDYTTAYAPYQYGSDLKNQLKQVARMLLAGAPSRAYWVYQGGYDSHSDQPVDHGYRLGEFSEGVTEFYTYLMNASAAVGRNVIVMTITDFGRRPNSNSTFGTDHGNAGVNFVVGAKVVGGVYGAYPDLTKIDGDGMAPVNLDFRNQISDIVAALGADPTAIVGKAYPPLGFV